MHIKNILAIALTSLLAAGTVQARDFRAADVHPLDYPTTMAVKRIGEIISKKTNGKPGDDHRTFPLPFDFISARQPPR